MSIKVPDQALRNLQSRLSEHFHERHGKSGSGLDQDPSEPTVKEDEDMVKVVAEAHKKTHSSQTLTESPSGFAFLAYLSPPFQAGTSRDAPGTPPQELAANEDGHMNFTCSTQAGTLAVSNWVSSGYYAADSGKLQVNAIPKISYNYGLSGVGNTNAYLGLNVDEFDQNWKPVKSVATSHVRLWTLSTQHGFTGSENFPLQVTFQATANHNYIIGVQADGAVVADGTEGVTTAWCELTVFLPQFTLFSLS